MVESIQECRVRVRITQTSACASCQLSGHCNASESKVKIIDVVTPLASSFRVGEEVVVSVSEKSARKALLVGFGLPLAVMVLTLFACLRLTSDEALSALVGLAVLIPYYIMVWIFRRRIDSSVIFGIEKLEQ